MSKVSAHRHVTWAKQVTLGCLIASLCVTAIVTAGCSARATGDEDIVAVARGNGNKAAAHPRNTSSEPGTLDTVTGSEEPNLEPSDTAAAGSGGSSAPQNTADAGSGTNTDAAADEDPNDPNKAPSVGGALDVPRETVLFWVDAVSSRVWRANADGGTDRRLLAGALSIAAPDGITVDLTDGFVYWTNMGTPVGGAGVGSLQRMRLEDETIETVIPVGTTSTPKQINIDNQARQLYWSDRDSMVWRSELDGSQPEVILSRHSIVQPAGMGLDVAKRQMYITDRASGRLYRVGFDMPEGATPENRPDVELLVVYSNPLRGAMPLNIAMDLNERRLYWTDRERGVIFTMGMDIPAGSTPQDRTDIKILLDGLVDPVGIALDDVTKRLYFTELSGRVSRVNLDGSNQEVILQMGAASGIALAHLPE